MTLLASAALLLLPAGASGAAGELDRDLDGNGRLVVRANEEPSKDTELTTGLRFPPMASASAANDDIVWANDRLVLRYRADGRPRRSFGGNGRVPIATPPGTSFWLAGVATDSRGRVLVAGTTVYPRPAAAPGETAPPPPNRAVVRRYLPDGALDRGFGADGTLETDLGQAPPDGFSDPSVALTGIAVDSADRPLLVGFSAATTGLCNYLLMRPVFLNRTFVARLTENGTIDSSFGSAGIFEEPSLEDPHLPAIAPSGMIAFVNRTERRCPRGGQGRAPVISVLGDDGVARGGFPGAPDGTFGLVGGLSLAVDERDRIVLLFERFDADGEGDRAFHVRRLRADGSPDQGFGREGAVRPRLPSDGTLAALTTDDRNRVLLAGSAPNQRGRGYLVMRLNAAGKLQRWFGRNGINVTGFGKRAKAAAEQIHRDGSGRIVLGGTVEAPWIPTGYGLAFSRYQGDGG